MSPQPALRALHLLEPCAGDEAILACAAAVAIPAVTHRVWIIGSGGCARRAEALGVPIDGRVAPALGRPELALFKLRRLMDDRDRELPEGTWADVVQCYSVGTLGLARLAVGKRKPPRIGVLSRPPVGRSPGARERFALHDATLLVFDHATRDAYAEAASARRGGAYLRDNIRLCAAPGVMPRSALARRDEIRASLGIEPEHRAVVFLADPAGAGDAMRMAFTLGLCFVRGQRTVGVLPRGCTHARRAARFVRTHGRSWGLVFSDLPMTDLIAGADAGVWDAGEPSLGPGSSGPMLLRSALAGGLPIVAGPGAPTGDASGHPLVRTAINHTPAAVGAMLMEVLTSPRPPALAGGDDFATTLAELWNECANRPMHRPGLPVPTLLVGTGALA